MALHKEGYPTIITSLLIFIAVNVPCLYFVGGTIATVVLVVSTIVITPIINFFRNPKRFYVTHEGAIIAPADGTIVVIEECHEPEVLNKKCLQVSIFMSVTNVHINWFPISGVVKYYRHHSGHKMAAYLPKSATENERSSVLIEDAQGRQILVRQVAGALARRIVTYCQEGSQVRQSEQMGFIKFGSRVDLYLPLGTQIDVHLQDQTRGGQTVIGWLK